MGIQSIRLGSTLTFDDEKEKDIIKSIEQLNSCHKTGQFISNLIRIAFDCPEIIRKSSNSIASGEVLKQIEQMGMQKNRKDFFSDISKKANELKQKVDKIYDMSFKMYMVTLMGKQIGLNDRSKNTLKASFMIEQQLNELQKILGNSVETFDSNKIKNTEEKAKECLEYIIEAYDGVVNELREGLAQTIVVQANAEQSNTTQTESSKAEIDNKLEKDSEEQEDELIDFGSDALSNFFGQ